MRGLNFWRRGSAALPMLVAALLLAGFDATAETTNTLSDAEIQGRQLAQQLLQQQPATNFAQHGVLKIRDANGKRSEILVKCEVIVTTTNWQSLYKAKFGTNATDITTLVVTHCGADSNRYVLFENEQTARIGIVGIHIGMGLSGNRTMIPFACSDFWLCDLGLEFFHWPAQKILKKEVKRSRGCTVLESMNSEPATNGYSRVVSWIDEETLGIVQAQAFDARGKLLKEFYPKSFKKVNGQWELEDMDIRNVQTGSRTRFEFDLKAP